MFRLDINLGRIILLRRSIRLIARLQDVLTDESASDEFCLKRKVLIGTGAGLIQRRFPLNSNKKKEKNSQKLVSIQ